MYEFPIVVCETEKLLYFGQIFGDRPVAYSICFTGLHTNALGTDHVPQELNLF